MSLMTTDETTQNSTQTNKPSPLHEGISEVKQDAKNVKEDLDALKQDAAKLTSHATEQAIEAVKTGAKSAGEVACTTGQKMKQTHSAVCDQVRARPTASVLLALGAGVMIGRVLAATRR